MVSSEEIKFYDRPSLPSQSVFGAIALLGSAANGDSAIPLSCMS